MVYAAKDIAGLAEQKWFGLIREESNHLGHRSFCSIELVGTVEQQGQGL